MFKGQTQRQIPLLFFIIVKMDLFKFVKKAFHVNRLLFVPLNLEEFLSDVQGMKHSDCRYGGNVSPAAAAAAAAGNHTRDV